MSFGPATKPIDHETMALIAAFTAIKRAPAPKAERVAYTPGEPIVMSRRAAAPVRPSVTIGYPERALRDDGCISYRRR